MLGRPVGICLRARGSEELAARDVRLSFTRIKFAIYQVVDLSYKRTRTSSETCSWGKKRHVELSCFFWNDYYYNYCCYYYYYYSIMDICSSLSQAKGNAEHAFKKAYGFFEEIWTEVHPPTKLLYLASPGTSPGIPYTFLSQMEIGPNENPYFFHIGKLVETEW